MCAVGMVRAYRHTQLAYRHAHVGRLETHTCRMSPSNSDFFAIKIRTVVLVRLGTWFVLVLYMSLHSNTDCKVLVRQSTVGDLSFQAVSETKRFKLQMSKHDFKLACADVSAK